MLSTSLRYYSEILTGHCLVPNWPAIDQSRKVRGLYHGLHSCHQPSLIHTQPKLFKPFHTVHQHELTLNYHLCLWLCLRLHNSHFRRQFHSSFSISLASPAILNYYSLLRTHSSPFKVATVHSLRLLHVVLFSFFHSGYDF